MLSPQYISLKHEKPGLNWLQSPIRPDFAELLIFLLIYLLVGLNKRLKQMFPKPVGPGSKLGPHYLCQKPDKAQAQLAPKPADFVECLKGSITMNTTGLEP